MLSEGDVTDALREIRRHLLEADVSFEVTRGFVERVREVDGPAGFPRRVEADAGDGPLKQVLGLLPGVKA